MRNCLLTIILLLLVASASAATVDQQVDGFSLKDLNNQTHRASQYRGKVLVLAIIGFN